MSRPIRDDTPGATFHVTGRVNWQVWHLARPGFRDKLLSEIQSVAREFSMDVLGAVVMSNHYHFVIRSPGVPRFRELTTRLSPCRHRRPWPKGNLRRSVLSRFLHRLMGRLSTHYQHELEIGGCFWERRAFVRRISNAQHLVVALAYDHRNPVRGGIVLEPEDYIWSSATWWARGTSSVFSLRADVSLPFHLTIEALREDVRRFQRSRAFSDLMQSLSKSPRNWETPSRLKRLPQLLEEAGLPLSDPLLRHDCRGDERASPVQDRSNAPSA